jgi:hypothetical protein
VNAKGKSNVVLATVEIIVSGVLAELALLVFPAASDAVFAATLMPTVPPSPVQAVRVTVGVAVVPLVTPRVQLAPPVVFKVISLDVRLYVVPPVYVTGNKTAVVLVSQIFKAGAPAVTAGRVLSTVNVVLAVLTVFAFPKASDAVPALMVMPTVPSPVQLDSVTVGVAVVPLLTTLLQLAPSVVFSVMPAAVRLYVEPPE